MAAVQPFIRREWGMPNHETFDIKPIGDLVRHYLKGAPVSVDPYARNKDWATFTNDLNPNTTAQRHMDAVDFLLALHAEQVVADLMLVDPPYSVRQVKECYDSIGHKMQQGDALLGAVRKRLKGAIDAIVRPGGIVIWCGWNTVGMGKTLGYVQREILITCHGSDHK